MLPGLPDPHPALIHLPLVLLPLALLVELSALAGEGRQGRERQARLLWVLGALAASATFLAGRAAADAATGISPQTHVAIGTHADWATWALGMAWATAGIALLRSRTRAMGRAALQGLTAVVGLGLMWALVLTADAGGALVYQHAVAVRRSPVEACAEVTSSPGRLAVALTDVGGTLTWIPADASAPFSGFDQPDTGGAITVDGAVELLLPPILDDVQVNVYLDRGDFEGVVTVLHHVANGEAGGFAVGTTAPARLMKLGEADRVLDEDEGDARLLDHCALSVHAAGAHFKGLIDGLVVAHGHGLALPPGRVGVRATGHGELIIRRIEAVRLLPTR